MKKLCKKTKRNKKKQKTKEDEDPPELRGYQVEDVAAATAAPPSCLPKLCSKSPLQDSTTPLVFFFYDQREKRKEKSRDEEPLLYCSLIVRG